MGTPRTEIHHSPALRRQHHPCCLTGYHGLKGKCSHQVRFYDLRLHQGCSDSQQGFASKNHRTFGNSPYIASKAKPLQGIEPGAWHMNECGMLPQIADLGFGEAQVQ
ncbi:hypothetical protein HRbin36_02572 [bacterium HR36]|nr:hypothetical protein HRbin36_02572 [bacterium HR36]